jgi:hypothetical protein
MVSKVTLPLSALIFLSPIFLSGKPTIRQENRGQENKKFAWVASARVLRESEDIFQLVEVLNEKNGNLHHQLSYCGSGGDCASTESAAANSSTASTGAASG